MSVRKNKINYVEYKIKNINKEFFVYAREELYNIVEEYVDLLAKELKDCPVLIYEKQNLVEKYEGDAFSLPWYGREDTFDMDEDNIIAQILQKKFEIETKKSIYIIVLYKSVFSSKIKCIYCILHEIRHIQQFAFDDNVHEVILEIMESSDGEQYLDLPFEIDAVIYAKEKLIEAGFNYDEIAKFFKSRYSKRSEIIMKEPIRELKDVVKDIQDYCCG